jgi:hypothetical protein
MNDRLKTGIAIELYDKFEIRGNTFPIKETLKAMGMKFELGAWTYEVQTDEEAIKFLTRLHQEFPNWDEREFGELIDYI